MVPGKAPRERRRKPRIRERLPIRVRQEGAFEVTETLDLSAIGACCRLHRPLAEMTRLRILLSLPGDGGSPHEQVTCEGVVVRSESHGAGDHRVAIFFDTFNETERRKLSRFIARRLETP
jgi:hypothetical protein